MPHVILEYTDNLSEHVEMQGLLKSINDVLIERNDIFPTGGIRSRAHEVKYYQVADGKENDAFIHAVLKIGKGRSEEEKQAVCNRIFSVIKDYLEPYAKDHYLALSLELVEFQHAALKKNNIHQRFI
ncbi:5-carboxymethyl-2-hydroxymuconate Delta-isomerase [Halobacillus sp. Marseille-Q1614]|uniref:5-carboxymethyl-2-hydroxymuconate Delta-isomerase n=1 Tax=Halobacillus sp. Marseille-Q1614 TaxID=2709134 RepID=UPI00156E36A2|nr:5-carboxymethyl-2-hydroxymuconate Delta-isomerase [Halobacillus sp. Marseille-Q1614]